MRFEVHHENRVYRVQKVSRNFSFTNYSWKGRLTERCNWTRVHFNQALYRVENSNIISPVVLHLSLSSVFFPFLSFYFLSFKGFLSWTEPPTTTMNSCLESKTFHVLLSLPLSFSLSKYFFVCNLNQWFLFLLSPTFLIYVKALSTASLWRSPSNGPQPRHVLQKRVLLSIWRIMNCEYFSICINRVYN